MPVWKNACLLCKGPEYDPYLDLEISEFYFISIILEFSVTHKIIFHSQAMTVRPETMRSELFNITAPKFRNDTVVRAEPEGVGGHRNIYRYAQNEFAPLRNAEQFIRKLLASISKNICTSPQN